MTRRDLQNETREKKRPWDIGKSVRASGADRADPPRVAGLAHSPARDPLDVNGAPRQRGDVADMIWEFRT